MLNRIYIIIGLLAIIVLASAFVVPRFIQWGDYRDRMEVLATGVLGSEVTILGDIEFDLLPAPHLKFTEVVVGNLEEPIASVAAVDAEFSLIEFLRDQYNLTNLVLTEPVVDLIIDEQGLFASGLTPPADAVGNVVLEQASIINGRLRLTDYRAGQNHVLEDVDGELRLDSINGPFQFQGAGNYGEQRLQVRLNTSAGDGETGSRLSAAISASDGAFALTTEGQLQAGADPRFDGTMRLTQAPPPASEAEDIAGGLLLESPVQASTDRVVLSGYTYLPDANRPGTRLTGAASIALDAVPSFDAVVSGGIFALPPRDATENAAQQPYELVRLLKELPAPLLPPIQGTIGIDLAEMGLRGFALRDVRMDAAFDGEGWDISQFIARLPGETEIRATGRLGADGVGPSFAGSFSIVANRLDALSTLWRRPADGNPLFNTPGSLTGTARLGGDALGIADGVFTLEGTPHSVGIRIGFGDEPRLDLTGQFAALSDSDSAAMAALLPDIGAAPTFGVSFPEGSFALSAEGVTIDGLAGTMLAADGDWSAGRLRFERLAAEDFGGAEFALSADLAGTLDAPIVSGRGRIAVAAAASPALAALYEALDLDENWRSGLVRAYPLDLDLVLSPPGADGRQDLRLDGIADGTRVDLGVQFAQGIARATTDQMALRLFLEDDDPEQVTRQLGLGEDPVFSGENAMFLAANLTGSFGSGFGAQINASSGLEAIGYDGDLILVDGEVQGTGALQFRIDDIGGLATALGARDFALPALTGSAQLAFEGDRLFRLTGIEDVGGRYSGTLSMSKTGQGRQFGGEISLAATSLDALTRTVLGRTGSMVLDDGPWPDGPIELRPGSAPTRGEVVVSIPTVALPGDAESTDVSFVLEWADDRVRLADIAASVGGGSLSGDLTLCCASTLTEKSLTGRLMLDAVALEALVPQAVSDGVAALVSGGVQFETNGEDVAQMMSRLAGEGSFALADLVVDQLDPQVYDTVADLDDVLDTDPDALRALMGLTLDVGPFEAASAEGAFAIAGGVARFDNLSFEGEGARLSGQLAIGLANLGLNGVFTMTPLGFENGIGIIDANIAQVITGISGTLLEPIRSLDLDTLVAAIQVRANELEVDRLEVLRLENEARQREAAEARNRLIEQQLRQRAAEEAERRAQDAQEAEEAEAQPDPEPEAPPVINQPLTLQPGFNLEQPFFTPLN